MVVDMSTFREVIWPMVRINKYYVVSIGAWQFYAKPSDSFVKKSLIRLYSVYSWITIIFWLSLYILTQFMELVRAWGDIVQMANCVFLFCTVIATLVKYMCLYDNNRTFRFVLKHIYSEDEFLPQSNRELSIVQDAVSLSIKLRTFYFLTCASSLLFIILYPIYLINDTGKSALPVAAYFPLDLQNKLTFVLVYIYQSIGLSLQCMACVAIDSLFCGLLIVAGAQLNILQLRLAAMSDSNPNKKRHSIKQQLLHCVHHHQNIKRSVEKTQEVYETSIVSQFLTSAIVICVNGFRLTVTESSDLSNPVGLVLLVAYQFAMLTQLFLYCFFGNFVSWTSGELSGRMWESNWINFSLSDKKLFHIFLKHIADPIPVKVLKLFPLSLGTFMQVLNKSYTYFALLRTMQMRSGSHS